MLWKTKRWNGGNDTPRIHYVARIVNFCVCVCICVRQQVLVEYKYSTNLSIIVAATFSILTFPPQVGRNDFLFCSFSIILSIMLHNFFHSGISFECLVVFGTGDTVNVARRIEPNYCWEAAAKLVKVQGPSLYRIPRGSIPVKGKARPSEYLLGPWLKLFKRCHFKGWYLYVWPRHEAALALC